MNGDYNKKKGDDYMYYELDNNEIKQVKEIENITGIEYIVNKKYVEAEDLMFIIKDLLCMYHILEEKYEDLKGE